MARSAGGYLGGMPQPQQPELRRSGESATDDDHVKTQRGVAGAPGLPADVPPGTPEANRPGHHPEVEQDKPDGAAFARRFGIPIEEGGEGGEADGASGEARGEEDAGSKASANGARSKPSSKTSSKTSAKASTKTNSQASTNGTKATSRSGSGRATGARASADLAARTKAELVDQARASSLVGYSRMNKAELVDALRTA